MMRSAVGLIVLSISLAGCMGGTIAQRIASSIITHAADKAVGAAVEAQDRAEQAPRNIELMNTEPDPYAATFALMRLPEQPAPQPIVEPLPGYVEVENGRQRISSHRLVRAEVLNLLLGDEKRGIIERSLRNGSGVIPATPDAWKEWQVAEGRLTQANGPQILFLIPPELGKMRSGDTAVIEVSSVGGLHVARYRGE